MEQLNLCLQSGQQSCEAEEAQPRTPHQADARTLHLPHDEAWRSADDGQGLVVLNLRQLGTCAGGLLFAPGCRGLLGSPPLVRLECHRLREP